ncbi:MAG: hypothetical protein ACFFEF_15435 [Candidatus Thorarchaeota archaeon]
MGLKHQSITPINAAGIIAVVSLVTPVVFMFHPLVTGLPPHFTIVSMLYTFDYLHGIVTLTLATLFSGIAMFLAIIPRFIFSFQVYRLYSGVSSLRYSKGMGIISEIVLIALAIPLDISSILTYFMTGWMTSLMFPMPFPLLALLILLKYRPPEGFSLWKTEGNGIETEAKLEQPFND